MAFSSVMSFILVDVFHVDTRKVRATARPSPYDGCAAVLHRLAPVGQKH
jgi:hypothetical protein